MHPYLFSIGSFTFYSYGLLLAIGLATALAWAIWRIKQDHENDVTINASQLTVDQFVAGTFWVILGAIIGARIFYVVQFYDHYLQQPWWQTLNIRGGGLVFYGGLIGGLLAVTIYAKIQKISLATLLDIAAPATILGYAIGRLGCLLNGCCYGMPTTMPWGVCLGGQELAVHPTPIYSSLIAVMIFWFLARWYPRRPYAGAIFMRALVLYSLYRFSIEFLRDNPLYGPLTAAQWLALATLPLVWLLRHYFIKRARHKRHEY